MVCEPAEDARSHDDEAIKSTYQRLDTPERNSPRCRWERNGFRNDGLLSWQDRHDATLSLLQYHSSLRHLMFRAAIVPVVRLRTSTSITNVAGPSRHDAGDIARFAMEMRAGAATV